SRDACSPESQTFQDFDIRPRSTPKRAQSKPACAVKSCEIVNKSQDLDARHRLPTPGQRPIALPSDPIFRRWTGCSNLWPSLKNKSINSFAIGLIMVICDGEKDGTCRSRTIQRRHGLWGVVRYIWQ